MEYFIGLFVTINTIFLIMILGRLNFFKKIYLFFVKNNKNKNYSRPDPNDDSGCPTEKELLDD